GRATGTGRLDHTALRANRRTLSESTAQTPRRAGEYAPPPGTEALGPRLSAAIPGPQRRHRSVAWPHPVPPARHHPRAPAQQQRKGQALLRYVDGGERPRAVGGVAA